MPLTADGELWKARYFELLDSIDDGLAGIDDEFRSFMIHLVERARNP